MSRLAAFILALTLLPAAAFAQTPYEPPAADTPDSSDSLEQGVENFMRKLLDQAQPHLDRLGRDLGDTIGSVGPVLRDIGKLMDDVGNYQAPERLENGDILIRRRPDAPPPPPVGESLQDLLRPAPEAPPRPAPEPDPDTEIEL